MKRKKSKKAILVSKADELFQLRIIKNNPRSIVSGEPTEVAHHYIPKSQSNNLRYDDSNGVPLTHKEHFRHHNTYDPAIIAKVLQVKGQAWHDDLQARRRIRCRLNIGFLEEVIERLEK